MKVVARGEEGYEDLPFLNSYQPHDRTSVQWLILLVAEPNQSCCSDKCWDMWSTADGQSCSKVELQPSFSCQSLPLPLSHWPTLLNCSCLTENEQIFCGELLEYLEAQLYCIQRNTVGLNNAQLDLTPVDIPTPTNVTQALFLSFNHYLKFCHIPYSNNNNSEENVSMLGECNEYSFKYKV